MAITADQLLTGVKQRIVLPASQALLSDSDILSMADKVIQTKLIPLLKSVNQDFFVRNVSVPLVNGINTYAIPYRAMGRTLRDVKLQDNATPFPNRADIALIALEDEHLYRVGSIPVGFYFCGDNIVIIPVPLVDNYFLQLWYELPPAKLIPTSSAAIVQTVGATSLTVVSSPATIQAGGLVDFIAGQAGCQTFSFDQTLQNISGTTYTFDAGVIPSTPISLAAGDYISPAGYSPVIQIPDEAYPYLETCLSIRILKTIGDFDGAGRLADDERDEEKNLNMILEPRVTGENTKIINRRGMLRGYRGRFLTGRYYY